MTTALAEYGSQYVAKKALFSFMGNTFRIFDPAGTLQFYIKQKAFKLKEEINIFRDEAQTDTRLTIKARTISDRSGAYDIVDASSGETIGGAKRHGLKSMFRDEWSILDSGGGEAGKVVENASVPMLLLRRFIPIIPQKYSVTWGGSDVGSINQRFNLFGLTYDVDFSAGGGAFDPRLGVALTVLLLAIEGGRDSAR